MQQSCTPYDRRRASRYERREALEITADGRNWVPAQSKIDGERLIVWPDGVGKPTDVRYCWKSKADEPFLYNKARLPAAQFNSTTDYAFVGPRPAAAKRGGGRRGSAARRRDDTARREVRLASAFGENAVLQRGVKVPVWGYAAGGEKITVTFAGQTKSAAADSFGRWRVELDAMPASAEPRTLVARGANNSVEAKGVYVGDVWLYLSQSWHLGGPKELRVDHNSLPPICASASAGVWEHRNHSRRPQAGPDKGGRWTAYKAPGRYYRNDGYYLGLGLARVTNAPVGVMGLGASTLESMTPPEGFEAFEKQLGELGRTVITWTPRTQRGRQAYVEGIEAIDGWIEKTRGILRSDGVTFGDLTQPPRLPGPPDYLRGPMTTYNFVTHRFTPAAMRGIIIQPKTFSLGDPMYLTKAKALIRGLREACGRKGLPVCFVQMHTPGRYELKETEDPDDWVRLRAAQNELARLPYTTVIATYDLKSPGRSDGDPGLRAAQWAAALVKSAPIKTGPTCKKHRADGASIIIEFDQVGRGLMVGESATGKPVRPTPDAALAGFQLAGPDNQWHAAAAAIEGNTVVVTCAKVKHPAAVRYAWTPQPKAANLYNNAGFPALPFSTAE